MPSRARSPRVRVGALLSCQVSRVWNSGLWARLRNGRVISTTCSKGRSWWAWAASVRALTRASSASALNAPEVSIRTARVFTNRPINPSTSLRVRLAAGEPITRSCCPDRRDNNAAQALIKVMYNVVPWRWLKALSPAVRRSSSCTLTLLPA